VPDAESAVSQFEEKIAMRDSTTEMISLTFRGAAFG
jgi:hypothetical protein